MAPSRVPGPPKPPQPTLGQHSVAAGGTGVIAAFLVVLWNKFAPDLAFTVNEGVFATGGITAIGAYLAQWIPVPTRRR